MKATKVQIEAEICRRSFYEFSLEAFKVLHNGSPMDENWHIEYLCDVVQKEVEGVLNREIRDKHLLINVPPRSLKSELINVYLSVWLWVRDDSKKFISTSYASRLSTKHSKNSRRILESEWFREHYPDIQITQGENTQTEYTTPSGGNRYSTSTGGAVTGTGADIIVIDDPQDPTQSRSEVKREAATDYFKETLSSRLNEPEEGLFIVIMQRLHENDLTGMLLDEEPDKWIHICLPAEDSDNVKPIELRANYIDGLLFPKRLSHKVLDTFKTRLGTYGYSGQMGQLPSPQDGGILKGKWFNIVDNVLDADYKIVNLNELNWDFFFDTAYTKKQSNDPSALLACAFYNNNLYIRSVATVHMEFPELVKEIPSFCYANGYNTSSMAYVEPKASGKSIVQQLKTSTSLNIIEGKIPDTDKISRVNGASPFIESGRCYLLSGDWNKSFLDECNSFPNGSHDDQVDVLTMAIDELAQDNKFIFIG